MTNSTLSAYLTEHMAGATAAVSLLRRLARRFRLPFLRDLLVEIQADVRTLEAVMQEVGVRKRPLEHRLAEAGVRVVEWRNRVGAKGLSSDFELFHGLELLAIGISGKRCLWRALQTIAADEPTLQSLDLAGLERRAVAQLDRVEAERLATSTRALLPTSRALAATSA